MEANSVIDIPPLTLFKLQRIYADLATMRIALREVGGECDGNGLVMLSIAEVSRFIERADSELSYLLSTSDGENTPPLSDLT